MVLQNETNYKIFIPESIAKSRERILQLLSVTCGRDDLLITGDAVDIGENGYLVLVQNKLSGDVNDSDSEFEHPIWLGKEISVELTVETAIALSHIKVLE